MAACSLLWLQENGVPLPARLESARGRLERTWGGCNLGAEVREEEIEYGREARCHGYRRAAGLDWIGRKAFKHVLYRYGANPFRPRLLVCGRG